MRWAKLYYWMSMYFFKKQVKSLDDSDVHQCFTAATRSAIMRIACVSAMLPRQQITLIVKGKKMRGERKTFCLSPSLVHSFVEYQTACTPVCVNIIFPCPPSFISFIALFCSVFFCCLKLKHHLILWSWIWSGLLSASASFLLYHDALGRCL